MSSCRIINEHEFENAPKTGRIMNMSGHFGIAPKRNSGLMIKSTPRKQTKVRTRLILWTVFL